MTKEEILAGSQVPGVEALVGVLASDPGLFGWTGCEVLWAPMLGNASQNELMDSEEPEAGLQKPGTVV